MRSREGGEIDDERVGAETVTVSKSCCADEGNTYTTETVVLVIILWLLDHVPSHDGLVAMTIVGFVCDKVCLSEELLLVVLEFSDHDCGSSSSLTTDELLSGSWLPFFCLRRRSRW